MRSICFYGGKEYIELVILGGMINVIGDAQTQKKYEPWGHILPKFGESCLIALSVVLQSLKLIEYFEHEPPSFPPKFEILFSKSLVRIEIHKYHQSIRFCWSLSYNSTKKYI